MEVYAVLPFFASIVFLFAFSLWRGHSAGTFDEIVEGISLLLILLTGVKACSDFFIWWYRYYIVTTQRIVSVHGFLFRTRQIVPLENIQQIGIEITSFFAFMLEYGNVHLYLNNADLIMSGVPGPRLIRDAIMKFSSGAEQEVGKLSD